MVFKISLLSLAQRYPYWMACVILVGVYPALNLLNNIQYPLIDAAALLFIAMFVAAGGLLALASQGSAILRTIVLFGLLIYMAYELRLLDKGLLYAAALGTVMGLDGINLDGLNASHAFSLLAVLFLPAVFVIWIGSWKKGYQFLTVCLSVMVLSEILLDGVGKSVLAKNTEEITVKKTDSDLPPVLLIVLDEQMGLAGLQEAHQDTSQVREQIKATLQDFEIFPNAYSRYFMTFLSVSSALNFTPFASLPPITGLTDADFQYRLEENRFAEQLLNAGYRMHILQNSHLDLCAHNVSSCLTASQKDLTFLEQRQVPLTDRLEFLFRLAAVPYLTPQRMRFPDFSPSGLQLFEKLQSLAQGGLKGEAVILHALLPHGRFMLDKECALTAPSSWVRLEANYEEGFSDYLAQISCTFRQLDWIFSAMKKSGDWEKATIIVMGDHGYRRVENWLAKIHGILPFEDKELRRVFSTLYAIKRPAGPAGTNNFPVEVQQALAEEFLPEHHDAKSKAGYGFTGKWALSPEDLDLKEIKLPPPFSSPD